MEEESASKQVEDKIETPTTKMKAVENRGKIKTIPQRTPQQQKGKKRQRREKKKKLDH